MNINEEGKYYASMVRKFRTEYKSKNLHGFCKEQNVSYTKIAAGYCYCFGINSNDFEKK